MLANSIAYSGVGECAVQESIVEALSQGRSSNPPVLVQRGLLISLSIGNVDPQTTITREQWTWLMVASFQMIDPWFVCGCGIEDVLGGWEPLLIL